MIDPSALVAVTSVGVHSTSVNWNTVFAQAGSIGTVTAIIIGTMVKVMSVYNQRATSKMFDDKVAPALEKIRVTMDNGFHEVAASINDHEGRLSRLEGFNEGLAHGRPVVTLPPGPITVTTPVPAP